MLRFFRGFSLLLFISVSAVASPPPGHYELYDGSGRKIGTVRAKVSPSTFKEKPSTLVEVETRIEFPELTSTYRFSEKDAAHIQEGRLAHFTRESDENGKKTTVTGEKRGSNLFIFVNKEGKKITTAVSFSAFDISEFEMDLPQSKFSALKNKGETASLRVFLVETLKPILVSRNVSDVMEVPYHEKEVPVVAISTLMNGKATTSWFHAETRDLLQEEGANHLMSRLQE